MNKSVRIKKQRQEAVYWLRNNAQVYLDYEGVLFNRIKTNIPMVLERPEAASKSQINEYNTLVRSSDIPLPRKEQYYLI